MTAHSATHTAQAKEPLAGRSVVVTRTREQSRSLAAPLEALGAEVIVCPVIAIVDPPDTGPADEAIAHLGEYDWVVLTSVNAVERLLALMGACGCSLDALAATQVAAVGDATAQALEDAGVTVGLLPPEEFSAEGLIDEFVARGVGPGWRILVPRALKAREVLPQTLRGLGAVVDVVPVYQTVAAEPDPKVVERLRQGVDAVTFTSPSTVRNFLAVLEAAGLVVDATLGHTVLASIGPVTSEALVEAGLVADVEADPSTVPALVDALAARLAR
ncbi:MAG: uroporphyrinogen-III synthase [Coriobacteriia bacterium]|nr:uroporphyrinogen-III synthase [Coriobacteriia bacterium]